MGTLITAPWVLTLDDSARVLTPGWVLTEGDRIADVGAGTLPDRIRSQAGHWVDLPGRVLLPGLVNGHTHLFQTFLRGITDTLRLEEWLRAVIWTHAHLLSPEDVEVAALVGCVENLKSGATFILDNHYLHTHPGNSDAVLEAMRTVGVRGMLARGATDYRPAVDLADPSTGSYLLEQPDGYFAEMDRLLARWQGHEGRLELAVAPTTTWAVTESFARRLGDYARVHGLPIHIHTAETRATVEKALATYGLRDVEVLHRNGLLCERTQMAHAVWLNAEEIRMAADHGATAVHCPVSNMYLASGVMDLPAMRAAGLRIALGTDGPASNNSQDNLEVLKAAACLQKVHRLDAAVVEPMEVLRYACRGGAEAVGKSDVLGSLEPGKYADMVAVRADRPHVGPVHRPESAVVYNANGNDVDWVMVGGRVLVEEGRCVTVDERELMARAQEQIHRFRQRAGLEPAVPAP